MKASSMLIAILAAGFTLSFGTPVRAAASSRDRALIEDLERQTDQLAESSRNMKGAPQQELQLRRAKLRSVIERLERGERVDPAEIDTLLGR